jgi:hypothetical protein
LGDAEVSAEFTDFPSPIDALLICRYNLCGRRAELNGAD